MTFICKQTLRWSMSRGQLSCWKMSEDWLADDSCFDSICTATQSAGPQSAGCCTFDGSISSLTKIGIKTTCFIQKRYQGQKAKLSQNNFILWWLFLPRWYLRAVYSVAVPSKRGLATLNITFSVSLVFCWV